MCLTKEIADKLAVYNSFDYNLRKAAEEFIELGLVLLQQINKPEKELAQEIIDEIGDVDIRLKVIKRLYNKEKIKSRIDLKTAKFTQWINEKKYLTI